VFRQITQLTNQTSDTFYVGIGLALGVAPKAEVLLGIGGGGVEDINGKQEMAFYLKTSLGERRAVLDDDGCRIYAYHRNDFDKADALAKAGDTKTMVELLGSAEYQKPAVGELLSHVNAESIATTIRVARKSNAGAAIALMMAKLGLAGQPVSFTAVPPYALANRDDAIRWQVSTCAFPVMIETTGHGATMLIFDEEHRKMTASKTEIETFLADYSAERVS
jgi:hypothetical protein